MTAAVTLQLCVGKLEAAASWDSCSVIFGKEFSGGASDVSAEECDTPASSGASIASREEDSDSEGWTSVAAKPRRTRAQREPTVRGAYGSHTEAAELIRAGEEAPMVMQGLKAQNRCEVRAGAPAGGDDRASSEVDFHTLHNWSKKSKGSWSTKNQRKVSEQIVRRVEQSCRSRGWTRDHDGEE